MKLDKFPCAFGVVYADYDEVRFVDYLEFIDLNRAPEWASRKYEGVL